MAEHAGGVFIDEVGIAMAVGIDEPAALAAGDVEREGGEMHGRAGVAARERIRRASAWRARLLGLAST